MYNIWGFLLQTISVSIVAGVILLLKKIFEDKLSPRWQYSIWVLLGIRVFVPVNITKYIIPQISYWMEVIKGNIEKILDSNYSEVYEIIRLQHVIPFIKDIPHSITDWLFVIYVLGVLVFGIKYLTAYIRLRSLLKQGKPVTNTMEHKMLLVCDTYDLKPCKMITIEGLTSAFICGVFRPILVVPMQDDMDEKILLHEFLHLKYHDTIQNVFWCVIRSLHWCNPFIHYVINQIENDMESLCDQRVLELLEGEERREYGTILLNMANQKYARVPGTTSISNGGTNISKRIAAIVRFKKYPKGMALVSGCIIMVLFWPMIIGSEYTFAQNDYSNYTNEYDRAMTIARIKRCGTVAGAIDTYAKGLYLKNGIYIASASSLSKHEEIHAKIEKDTFYLPGIFVSNIENLTDYYIYNLDQISEKEYTATICLDTYMYFDTTTPEYLEKFETEETVYNCDAYIFIPIVIKYEDAWVVEECGERYVITQEESQAEYLNMISPKHYYGKNDVGEIYMEIETKYTVNNTVQDQNLAWFTDISSFDFSPKPNAVFDYYEINKHISYTHLLDERPRSYIELYVKEMNTDDYFEPDELNFTSSDHTEDGWRIFGSTIDWNGSISDYSGDGTGSSEVWVTDMASKYSVKWNIAGVEQEDIILEEVTE